MPGDDGCSREGRAAARVGARRVESPGRRSVIEPVYRPHASTPPRDAHQPSGARLAATFDAGFLAPFPSGFLARVRTARARATGGVCDAARASHALSELKRVHGRDGTRVACVAMPRAVHHASQTATRRRSRVFRVSPVQAREKKHRPSSHSRSRRRDGTPASSRLTRRPHARPNPSRVIRRSLIFDSTLTIRSIRFLVIHAGGGAASGTKYKMSIRVPVGAVMNCADNTGAKNLYVISVKRWGSRLNRLPGASTGAMVMATVKKRCSTSARRCFPQSWAAAPSVQEEGRPRALLRGQRRRHRQPQG